MFLHAYDEINLGDDLFVRTIVNRYSNIKFYMWSDNQNKIRFQGLDNLIVLNKESLWLSFLQRLRPSFAARYRMWLEKRCDAVVYIGGSIFIEYDNWKQILNWWNYEAEHRKFFVLGANFGPYNSEDYRIESQRIFDKMQDICFRDRYSYELFKNCKNVRYAPDILFAYPFPEVSVKARQVFISVIDCSNKDEGVNILNAHEDYYVVSMAKVIEDYVKNGFSVILASFSQIEGDENAIQKILNVIEYTDKSNIKSLFYDGTNSEQILNALIASEYVIASRFHATIFAISAGRPVCPIVYSDKTIHVLEDLNLEKNYIDLRREQNLTYKSTMECMISLSALERERLKVESQKHFCKLDRVFRK